MRLLGLLVSFVAEIMAIILLMLMVVGLDSEAMMAVIRHGPKTSLDFEWLLSLQFNSASRSTAIERCRVPSAAIGKDEMEAHAMTTPLFMQPLCTAIAICYAKFRQN